MRLLLGSFLAAIAMFFWGFLFWAVGISDPFTHPTADAESAIVETLSSNLVTEDGTYILPDSKNWTKDEGAARMKEGPFVMLHYYSGGTAMGDPKSMGFGFLHMFICCLLFAIILQKAAPGVPGYLDKLRYATLIGVLIAVFAQLGNPIWWHHTWHSAIRFAEYDLVSFMIAGAILAKFTRTE